MLFNEPKLLKSGSNETVYVVRSRFSALQRAEIAEIYDGADGCQTDGHAVSVLFNEPKLLKLSASIAATAAITVVSVLFNEPKLLKCWRARRHHQAPKCVSVLFNEPKLLKFGVPDAITKLQNVFQCSSTSRNC